MVRLLDEFYKRRLGAEAEFGPKEFFRKAELLSYGRVLGLTTIVGLMPQEDDVVDGVEVRFDRRSESSRAGAGFSKALDLTLSSPPRPSPRSSTSLARGWKALSSCPRGR